MIPWLLPWFESLWAPLHVFSYITVRAALAAGTAFALAVFLGGPLIARLRRVGVGEHASASDDEGVSQMYAAAGKNGTPTMGGVFWTTSILISTLLFARPDEMAVALGAFLLVGMGALGFLDDLVKLRKDGSTHGLSRTAKMLPTLAMAGFVAFMLHSLGERTGRPELTQIYVPLLKDVVISPSDWGLWGIGLFVAFEAFVVLGSSHAVNVTDGLDGLAAGLAIPVFAGLTIAVYATSHAGWAEYLHLPLIPGAGEVAVMGGAVLGATVGFLWFNLYPAQIFLGDSGSLPMGALMGYFAMVCRQELALPILAMVFVVEVGSSLLQILGFKFSKRFLGKEWRPFSIAPMHHIFQRKMPEPRLVGRFWILGVGCAALFLLTLKVR